MIVFISAVRYWYAGVVCVDLNQYNVCKSPGIRAVNGWANSLTVEPIR